MKIGIMRSPRLMTIKSPVNKQVFKDEGQNVKISSFVSDKLKGENKNKFVIHDQTMEEPIPM